MIFVDTGAWYASLISTDQHYTEATRWLRQNRQRLITTDFIVDETLTLLRSRGHRDVALRLGQSLFSGSRARVHYVSRSEITETWKIFRDYSDKDWSFTDCTSKVVMDRLKVTMAFTFDHHFKQFPGITVVP